MYGKEGKRTSYTPYSCVHIIMNGASASNEHHGCPFKHFSESGLRTKLVSKNVQSSGIEEIIKLVHGQHFQVSFFASFFIYFIDCLSKILCINSWWR